MAGIDAGKSNFRHRVQAEAPCNKKNSRSPGSTETCPSIVAARTGKTETTAAAAIAVGKPNPSQITKSGATATSGTICKIVASG